MVCAENSSGFMYVSRQNDGCTPFQAQLRLERGGRQEHPHFATAEEAALPSRAPAGRRAPRRRPAAATAASGAGPSAPPSSKQPADDDDEAYVAAEAVSDDDDPPTPRRRRGAALLQAPAAPSTGGVQAPSW